MSIQTDVKANERRRSAPLVWAGGLVAAAVLTLGVSGTLADWSSAILQNNNNTLDVASSVALEETGPDSTGAPTVCTTSGDADNNATCTTINKYGIGGVKAEGATALEPGDSATTTVSLENIASGDGTAFTLTPAACSSVYYTGVNSGNPPAVGDDVCSQLTVSVACTGANAVNFGPYTLDDPAWQTAQDLVSLASGETETCAFTVTLPSTTPANYAGQTVTQNLVWQLDA